MVHSRGVRKNIEITSKLLQDRFDSRGCNTNPVILLKIIQVRPPVKPLSINFEKFLYIAK